MLYTLRFFSLQNAVCFIMLTSLVPVLFTFYIQGVLKLKKKYFRRQRVSNVVLPHTEHCQYTEGAAQPVLLRIVWVIHIHCGQNVEFQRVSQDEYVWSLLFPRWLLNRLTPNDPYMGRTAPLTSKRCILYIYSTNIGTEYFKHALYSPFFSLQNAVFFIMLTCLVPELFTFYIQDVLKLKKNNFGAKGLTYKWAIPVVAAYNHKHNLWTFYC